MAKYYTFLLAELTISRLPKKVGYFIATMIADIVYTLSPRLRDSATQNIRHVLGLESDDAAIQPVVRGVLRNTAKNYFDLIKIPHTKPEDIERQVVPHDWHYFTDALARGKGVVLVTAHLGSFDMAAQLLAVRSIRTTVAVEALEPPQFLDRVISLRRNKGLNVIPARPGALEVMLQSLRRGEVVLLVCDRDVTGDSPSACFFGEETRLPDIAVKIAARTGSAVIPVFNVRRGDSRYDVYFEPAINLVPGRNGAVAQNMSQVIRAMEKHIRNYPDQWVVLRPVWNGHARRPAGDSTPAITKCR